MRTPKWTDSDRYPRGYTPSGSTNLRATFRRVREERKARELEQQEKVRQMKRKP